VQHSVFRVAAKEIATFFSTPVAFIFFGVFLGLNLFIFFWVETFFARNIADVRPLFEWMPVLMIFLVAALTMKMWSEERRMGTLEFLLTQPVSPLSLAIGKFLACLALVGIALLLTLPIPVTVSFLGNLDWGPVFGAYLASMFLAAAYIAIGLTVSAKSENQIVSLMVTVLICAVFYLLGSDTLTSLFGNKAGELLKALGSGSRFLSITRGVIDFRDLYYYLSIVGVFLSLNVYFLESGRWAQDINTNHRRWRLLTGLLVGNFIIANVWLQEVTWARADLTEGDIYSISDTSKNYIAQLQEPLLIRGYFSAKTHPLLAPLVPQLKDLILEYGVAGNGKIRAEFIDPLEYPELEEEAGQKYGIRPVPFQVADKYQAALVNSYFDVLIQYGDQYEVLNFRDLIEVKAQMEGQLDVKLRNPEYEITRSIKKVMYKYQSSGNLFTNINNPVNFVGYFSSDKKLPKALVDFKTEIKAVLDEVQKSSNNKFHYKFADPDAKSGELAKKIADEYGFRPMRAGLLDPTTFYFYMLVSDGEQTFQIPLPEHIDKESFRKSLDSALKRFSSGFMKTIALSVPPSKPVEPYMQQMRMPSGKKVNFLREKLTENHNVSTVTLDNGMVPEDADLLLMVAPEKLDRKQLFAVDQFLMKGGTVIFATSPYSATIGRNLSVAKYDSGLKEWFKHHGIELQETMVLDPQNAKLPIPIKRNIGGFTVQEIRMVEYPYFVDVRGKQLAANEMTSGLPQVTMNWSSPINIDENQNKQRKVTAILSSSEASWVSDSTQVLPDFQRYGELGFPVGDKQQSYPLAIAIEGQFESFFKGQDSPLLAEGKMEDAKQEKDEKEQEEQDTVFSSVIDKSAESARIIIFSSNEFVTDESIQLAASAGGTLYLNSIQLIENAIDWSLEDRGLLSIRGRGYFSRTLDPISRQQQFFWEYLNYGLALFGLLVIYLIYRRRRAKAQEHYLQLLQEIGA
jgi:gliding motility-associated transport system permease protein/gliding motility-associatede transport system auxiliary component